MPDIEIRPATAEQAEASRLGTVRRLLRPPLYSQACVSHAGSRHSPVRSADA